MADRSLQFAYLRFTFYCRNRPETPRKAAAASNSKDGRPTLQQRDITEEDSCPICMEDLLAKREPVTYCKYEIFLTILCYGKL